MKTMSIRDLRQRWPEAEAALQVENEIIITRDSKPVAKLICFSDAKSNRPRWDAKAHADWQRKISAGHISRSDAALAASRTDRNFPQTMPVTRIQRKRTPRKRN
jgi:antitoxin (DNA-binding transcriptional repressor) of toxin-antitoxin stability system